MDAFQRYRFTMFAFGVSALISLGAIGCDMASEQINSEGGLGAALAESVRAFAGDFARQVLAAFLL